MAQALGVSVEDLLIVGSEKPMKKKAAKANGRVDYVQRLLNLCSRTLRRDEILS
jgi:hypothetical protein